MKRKSLISQRTEEYQIVSLNWIQKKAKLFELTSDRRGVPEDTQESSSSESLQDDQSIDVSEPESAS